MRPTIVLLSLSLLTQAHAVTLPEAIEAKDSAGRIVAMPMDTEFKNNVDVIVDRGLDKGWEKQRIRFISVTCMKDMRTYDIVFFDYKAKGYDFMQFASPFGVCHVSR